MRLLRNKSFFNEEVLMQELRPKVSIIGCGNVGVRYVYALMIKGIARQIVMVDMDRRRLEGEVMDLSHGVPYIHPVEVVCGEYSDIKNSDMVVITAGKKQKPGQSRMDLAKDNVDVYRQIIPEIMKYAPEAVFVVVSNPVDVLAYAAYALSGKNPREVISSGTVLDTARFRFLLSKHCRVDPHNIHAYILGEHGDTEFPAWSNAMIGGILFKDYCRMCGNNGQCNHDEIFKTIFNEVRDSAYKIIERKQETSYGIGLALVRITQAVIDDENAILPVSSLVNGCYGLNDVYLSLPAVVNRSGVREIVNPDLSPEELQALHISADAIKNTINHCGL